MNLFKSFLGSGDLPDPEEHAPFCLVCQLYLVWKDPHFKIFIFYFYFYVGLLPSSLSAWKLL